ncbi:MAG: transcription termination/antitermination protein NusG [Planctomycetota bacterium]
MVTEEEQSVTEPTPSKPESRDTPGSASKPALEADMPPVAEPPSPEEIELVRPGMDWYVLRVASNKEDQVRDALERKVKIEQLEERVGRVLVPTQRERRVRGGTSRVYHRKLYPGYVFVEMATDEDGRIPENVWFVIKETTGVGDFIGSGGKPSPMPRHDVEKMQAAVVQHDESPTLANLAFKKDDRVKVTEGPFENFEGVVDEINTQKGTVRVIVTIFGRATPIEIEYWQVEQV